MPPHCDSMDGPVVTAARRALEAHDPALVLPFVKADGETEVLDAFRLATAAHDGNPAANEAADLHFFETVVRVHRAGEGAPFTGLRPAGLGFGPVVPVAERAFETGDPGELAELLARRVRDQVHARFDRAMMLRTHAAEGVPAARAHVEAMLGLEIWAHELYERAGRGPHGEPEGAPAHEDSAPAAAPRHEHAHAG